MVEGLTIDFSQSGGVRLRWKAYEGRKEVLRIFPTWLLYSLRDCALWFPLLFLNFWSGSRILSSWELWGLLLQKSLCHCPQKGPKWSQCLGSRIVSCERTYSFHEFWKHKRKEGLNAWIKGEWGVGCVSSPWGNVKNNRGVYLEIVERKKFQIRGSIQEEELEAQGAELRAWLGISMGSVW